MTSERKAVIQKITDKYNECPYPAPRVSRRAKPRLTVDLSSLSEESLRLRDEFYMSCAAELAQCAAARGDVPVGAVVVCENKIISADFNGREEEKNALYHAETAAIGEACRVLGGWRLPGCELFVTLEPCIMCAGAVVASRMPRVVFGAADKRAGAMGSVTDICALALNHRPEVKSGVLAEKCEALLQDFFRSRR